MRTTEIETGSILFPLCWLWGNYITHWHCSQPLDRSVFLYYEAKSGLLDHTVTYIRHLRTSPFWFLVSEQKRDKVRCTDTEGRQLFSYEEPVRSQHNNSESLISSRAAFAGRWLRLHCPAGCAWVIWEGRRDRSSRSTRNKWHTPN
jgi:hypothetical protein